jgi:hypothetical protein
MRAALNITGAALALGIILFSFASNALVSPKEEVAEATQAWARALGEDDPEKVLPLYADDAARCHRPCARTVRHSGTIL